MYLVTLVTVLHIAGQSRTRWLGASRKGASWMDEGFLSSTPRPRGIHIWLFKFRCSSDCQAGPSLHWRSERSNKNIWCQSTHDHSSANQYSFTWSCTGLVMLLEKASGLLSSETEIFPTESELGPKMKVTNLRIGANSQTLMNLLRMRRKEED